MRSSDIDGRRVQADENNFTAVRDPDCSNTKYSRASAFVLVEPAASDLVPQIVPQESCRK